jgi:hypothetical protein
MKTKLGLALAAVAALSTGFHPVTASAAPWKFGVISDTQWLVNNDGKSPASVPAGFIKQINQGFIANGVKLVVSVGDSEDLASGNNEWAIKTRQLYVQDLYNAGIAYYPLRGNHEAGGTNSSGQVSALTQGFCYPQITNGGVNNVAIVNPISSIISGWVYSASYDGGGVSTVSNTLLNTFPPATRTNLSTFTLGSNFSYPTNNNTLLNGSNSVGGLTYSFDYNNVRFVLLDPYTGTSTTPASNTIALMQPWITDCLTNASRPLQAFVFGHANIIGGSHKDNLFGAQIPGTNGTAHNDPGDCYGLQYAPANSSAVTYKQSNINAFVGSLYSNNVHYYIGGHDHHHKHSLIQSPLDSSKFVEQIISQSDSDKFYTPAIPFSANETPVDEQLYCLGLYIYTVDGPRVTADYYMVPANLPSISVETINFTPVLTSNWVKAISFGYSLNGKTFAVAEGTGYSIVQDNTTTASNNAVAYGDTNGTYVGSSFAILNGTNNSTGTTKTGRPLTKIINTGWAPATNTVSDIATVWGLTDLGSSSNDKITVAITFPTNGITDRNSVVLAGRDPKSGNWINAVDYNLVGGTKSNSTSAYSNAPTTLGSYGVDLTNGVAWAVINGNLRDFAVVSTNSIPAYLPWDFNNDGVVNTNDLAILATAQRSRSTNSVYDLNNDGKVDVSDQRWLALHYTHTNGQ